MSLYAPKTTRVLRQEIILRGDFNLFVSRLIDVSDPIPQILVPVCACITVIALGLFMSYEGIRLWKKKRHALSSQKSSPASDDQVKCLIDL